MQQPPLLPEVVLARVMRTASLNGMACFLVGTFFAIAMALTREVPFAAVGLLAAGAGAIELHGLGRLRRGHHDGMNWLILAQPLMLVVILGYCALRMTHFVMPEIPENLREIMSFSAERLGMTIEEYFRFVERITVQILAVVGLVYQSLMARYYLRRRAAVRQALEEFWGPEEQEEES